MKNNLDIVKMVFPNHSLEKQVEIHNFLVKQDWLSSEEITNAFSVITQLVKNCPTIKFLFDEKIEVLPWHIKISCTRQQIEDLSAIGINFTSQYINALIDQMSEEILSQLNGQITQILVTNKKFLKTIEMTELSDKIIISLNANFKVLTIKDLRKLKLKQINENI